MRGLLRIAAIALALVGGTVQAQDAAQTDRDRGLLQSFIEDNVSAPGREVRIEGFDGALSGRATIGRLTIADDAGVWLTMTGAVLDWNRAALLAGRLEVRELSAQRIEMVRPPRPAATPELQRAAAGSPFALPELPVAISVGALRIDTVDLAPPVLGEAVTLAVAGAAQLAGGAGDARLTVQRMNGRGALALTGAYDNTSRRLALDLSLQEPRDGVAARLIGLPGRPSVALTLRGDDPIDDFRAAVRLATDGTDRLTGTIVTTVTGAEDEQTGDTTRSRRIAADLGGDLAPVFAPDYAAFFGPQVEMQAALRLEADGTRRVDSLRVAARSVQIEATGAIGADGFPTRFDARLRLADPQADRLRVPFGADGVTLGGADLRLGYDRALGDGWQLAGRLERFEQETLRIEAMDLAGSGRIRGPQAGATGSVDGAVSLSARGLAPADPALASAMGATALGRFGFAWEQGGPLALRDLSIGGEDYRLTGDVLLRLAAQGVDLPADLDLRLAANDLSRFAGLAGLPDLAGAGNLAITGTVAPVQGAFDLALDGRTEDLALGQPMLDPLITGLARLGITARRDTSGLRLERLTIDAPHARLSASAALLAETGAARLRLDLPDLGRAQPGMAGAGTLEISADSTAPQEAWTIDARAALPGDTDITARGTLSDLSGAQRFAGRLAAEAGSLAPFSALAGLRLSGGFEGEAEVNATLSDRAGSLTLEARTRSPGIGLPLADALLAGQGSLSARLRRDAGGRMIAETARIATPAMSAMLSGEMTETARSLTFDARLPNGRILSPELAGAVEAAGTAQAAAGGDWRLALTGQGPAGTTLGATGTIAPGGQRADLALSGAAPLSLLNARITPRALGGLARYELRLAGPLALSALSGRITVEGAQLTLPTERLSVTGIAAGIELGGGRAQIGASGALSSGGTLRVDGPVSLAAPFVADLAVGLDGLVLRDPRLYRTSASGALRISGPLTGGATISGLVDLGATELRLAGAEGPQFADLPGLVHINEPAEVRRTRDWAGLLDRERATAAVPVFPIDVTLRAPARIFVRGRGLDAELGGELRLRGTTEALSPEGRFDLLRGRLDILGRRLILTEGFAQLQGSLEPYVYFAATTSAEDVQVTLALEGDAFAPELQLTSSPDLPQDEILSLLLFGRDVTRISPLQAVRLASALRTLSGRGGSGVTGKLRRSLALDDFDVTTDETGQVQARAGKYLSDNVYTDVTVNGSGETQINLNLKVSPQVTVRGRLGSDGDTGIGVYFEKDY